MTETKTLEALYDAVSEAEHVLAQVGENLLFQVKPEGGLEVVRRGPDGLPVEPESAIVDLAGADPLLWQAARPEGQLSLGQPYQDASPRCALTGRRLFRSSPVNLYYRGQPVHAGRALPFSPRLVFLHSLMCFLDALALETKAGRPSKREVAEGPEAAEAVGAEAKALWDHFLTCLQEAAVGPEQTAPAPDPKPVNTPEKN